MSSVKIGIGTAQFGSDYGISNPFSKTSPEEVERILAVAHEWGVGYIDTAPFYGSEEVLGRNLPRHHSFRICTKTPVSPEENLEEAFYRSLDCLKQESLYALLLHRPEHLLLQDGDDRIEVLAVLKEKRLVQKIGLSIYNQEILERVLTVFTPDIIQLPLNLFDQRLLQNGVLKELKKNNIEIHARSVFLQGLLLMEPETIPPYFNPFRREIRNYHDFLKSRKMTPLEASLRFVKGVKEVDAVLCGVSRCKELREIIEVVRNDSLEEDFSRFAMDDESILNPSLWQLA